MKKLSSRKSLVLLAAVVVNLVNVLVAILVNVNTDDAIKSLKSVGIYEYRIPIMAGLIVGGLLVAAWVFKAEKDAIKNEKLTDAVPDSQKATREFLADLATRYKERNEHKLDGRYQISLTVSEDVEGTPTRQFYEEFDTKDNAGNATEYIIELIERQGRLLIVGNPGSGKTVLLLTLAQYLTEKASENASQPLPVILNLDSWSSDYKHFEDWVKAMLTKGYGLSSDFAEELLTEKRIVFLLDGLDELARSEEVARAAEVRAGCLAALHKFLYDGTMSVVICCRREQFVAMLRQTGAELPVAAVVTVQDLTAGEIDRALGRASTTPRDKFAAQHLRAALSHDRKGVFQQVLSTPFYFTTALQVFDSTRALPIDAPEKETLETNLLETFINKKLQTTRNVRSFPPAKTLAWLTWLAVFLNGRKRVTFELSDLQPSALERPLPYRLSFSLIFGVVGGLILSRFRIGPDNIFLGSILGIIGGYIIAEDFTQFMLEPLRHSRTWLNILWQALLAGMLFSGALVVGLLWEQEGSGVGANAVAFLVILVIISAPIGALIAFVVGVLIRLVIRLVVGLLGGVATTNITTEDFAEWTLAPLLRAHTWWNISQHGLTIAAAGSAIGAGALSVAGILIGVAEGLKHGVVVTLFGGVMFMIIGGLVGAVIGLVIGLLLGTLRACRKVAQFAKISSSYLRLRAGIVFNIAQMVLIGGGLICLPVLLLMLTGRGWVGVNALVNFFLIIITCALIGLFRTALLRHAVLRLFLTLEGVMPLRYGDFLDYAAELRIIEKDGGQWRFRHQILQDYFVRRKWSRQKPKTAAEL